LNKFLSRVLGLDHSPFDSVQSDWHQHLFPYKLSYYRKQILSNPVPIFEIDFNTVYPDDAQLRHVVHENITSTGICHCVAIWYDLLLYGEDFETGVTLKAFDTDFPIYHTSSLKFFHHPIAVTSSSVLSCDTVLRIGDSDFQFNFTIA
jgi:hypothetical protein